MEVLQLDQVYMVFKDSPEKEVDSSFSEDNESEEVKK